MLSSLSNDRKVILNSALAGIAGMLAICRFLLVPNALLLMFIAAITLFAIYWFIPTLFSRSRQLERREVKALNSRSKKSDVIEYKYFNADGREVTPCTTKEKLICLATSIVISIILFLYPPFLFLESYFPDYDLIFTSMSLFIIASVPYLIRHLLYFYKDLPIDTSFTDSFVVVNSSYSSSSISSNSYPRSSRSSDLYTSPKHSYLSGNIFNSRNY